MFLLKKKEERERKKKREFHEKSEKICKIERVINKNNNNFKNIPLNIPSGSSMASSSSFGIGLDWNGLKPHEITGDAWPFAVAKISPSRQSQIAKKKIKK